MSTAFPCNRLNLDLGHFGGTLGHFGVTLRAFWGHFGLFWDHFGLFGGHFGVTLGHFGVTLGHLGVALGSFWGRIRFWTAPCGKVIRFAQDFSFPNIPDLSGNQRDPADLTAAQLHFLPICQSI